VGRFVKGDVVVIPFPFSDLSASKRLPALALVDLPGEDVILCQITSQAIRSPYAIPLRTGDFTVGGLNRDSNARPDRLFTADSHLIAYRAGSLTQAKVDEIVRQVVALITK
jgi:mRNA interferase MazF